MTDNLTPKKGRVYLVGAGPGDPKLITVKAMELLSRAEVVVNDRLANRKLLKYAPAEAEIVYAGKASRDHFLTQDEIINVIIDRALAGKMVVRLKGGDPFVFGRGGEEAEALAEAGIEFEIVPGVTSAVSVPAYAGIPVTSRTFATSFAVITGHESTDKPGSDIRWDKISTGVDTLVFLMGVENLPNIVRELIANGRSETTPVALVRWGTYPRQQTLVGTLADIVQKVQETGFKAPAVTIVGEVVKLRETISWFEKKPLFGKRIIVTRSQNQASALSDKLEELGADVDEFPAIRFIDPPDWNDVDSAISRIGEFNWILFTSANGVEWFVNKLFNSGADIRAFGNAKIGAIGPATAAALQDLKLRVDYVPSEYIAESVVSEFPEDLAGKKILIPRAMDARNELPDGLISKGADVCVASVYQTVIDTTYAQEVRRRLEEGDVDIIAFASSSTVKNFLALLGDAKIPDDAIIACIGPITAQTARDCGLKPTIIAENYTIDGLVDEILRHIAKHD